MRLICGVLNLDGANADEGPLRAIAAQLDVPRLRPSLCVWREGPIGLALLDFSAPGAPPPPLPEKASLTMAADVRIDDRAALAARLGGVAPKADDALLLEILAQSGPSGLNQVFGDFVFAVWDRNVQRLICGRDVFGVRPLAYVHQPGKFFAFASFPRALYGAGIVAKNVDEDALLRRVAGNLRHDDSLIVGIKRLPPAHVIGVSREGISLTRYWQLDRAASGTRRYSPEKASRELRRLVDEAVKCRLPRNGEIGAHLSGGLDSSSIAVLAARQLREQGRSLHAYSHLNRERNDIKLEDETEFVKAVLKQEGDIDWTPIRPAAASSTLVKTMDADKMTSLDADFPENAECQRAEEQGVSLVLSGWGGDEGAAFNGRGTLVELFLRGRWRALAREISALKRERGWPASRIFRGEVLSYLVPGPVRATLRRITGKAPDLQTSIFQSFSAKARRRLAASSGRTLGRAPDGRENCWRLMTSPHIAERAEIWAQIGARHGLAFAFPLLDRRVVEFSLSLSSELFLRDGFRRRLFRDAMADVLPRPLLLRHQKYLSLPGRMIDLVDGRNDLLAQIDIYERSESVRRIINLAYVRQMVQAFPSPERVREEMRDGDNPTSSVLLLAASTALTAAAYLYQHASE